jgi:hypothetical protein
MGSLALLGTGLRGVYPEQNNEILRFALYHNRFRASLRMTKNEGFAMTIFKV